ncbi:MAG: DsrE/DsrF/DrsH-like family protein [Lachnospiraceae bacterium]|nr:DsrE/DsrF/DrsH-like family protein [Lachnospiraceae bacterium]MBR4412080.1 DsrE/DsrF/DrsH-like family protein [Lachnospiraceae bacterium]
MEELTFKHISANDFAKLDFKKYTLVDLREPDEVLVSGIEGAVNIPFSQGFDKFDDIPKDKPVVVYCRVGDWSEEVAEILYDRGYDVTSLDGGYNSYRNLLRGESVSNSNDTKVLIDAKGLKCPGPIVKVADYLRDKPIGTTVYVEATEDAFASDIKVWCQRTGNHLDEIEIKEGLIKAQITRAEKKEELVKEQNDKTFVVFSGDLDKTIAAFIIANGAAAMGRKVTMFFTFWGLNILRKPKKVKVAKTFIEKMFGAMMPRGTTKLGLSRMNMGGAGAKMIRGIMKQKGISSLEELIESAKAHGVRIVACQMSMDIMGIHREELIDGVELGGVATFIGSGEESDMSLFI